MDVIENRDSLVYVGRVERVTLVRFDPGMTKSFPP
jgi:hypothetical protein